MSRYVLLVPTLVIMRSRTKKRRRKNITKLWVCVEKRKYFNYSSSSSDLLFVRVEWRKWRVRRRSLIDSEDWHFVEFNQSSWILRYFECPIGELRMFVVSSLSLALSNLTTFSFMWRQLKMHSMHCISLVAVEAIGFLRIPPLTLLSGLLWTNKNRLSR